MSLLLCGAQFVGDFLQELGGFLEAGDGALGALDGVGQVFVIDDGVVFDEAEVEAVALGGDLFARVRVPALVLDTVTVGGLIGLDEAREVLALERVRLAEGRHVRAQVVEPDFVRVPLVGRAARKEEHVRLNALRVEDARRQTQDGVQVALLHEVAADGLTVAVGEQDVVGQDNGGTRFAVCLKAAVDVLEEVELLVARRVGKVVARRALAALLRAERRIRQHDVVILEALAEVRERVAKVNRAVDAVQHGVHEREPMRVVDELAAGEGFLDFEVGQLLGEVGVVVRHVPDVLRGGNHEAERAAGRIGCLTTFDTITRLFP